MNVLFFSTWMYTTLKVDHRWFFHLIDPSSLKNENGGATWNVSPIVLREELQQKPLKRTRFETEFRC